MNINLKPNLPLWCRGMQCDSQASIVAKGILVVALTLSIALAVANMGIQAPARNASQLWPAAQILPAPAGLAPMSSSLVFSTYIGGSQEDLIRDVTTDASGNIYITGGTASPDFPTTPGAFQITHGGWMDVFVAKLNPDGQLLWSTRIGGPDYDRAYGLEVDNQGYVYVAGRAGPGFPTTANAFQPTYQGFYAGAAYGDQNAFVCKLMPDGASLVFCSYIGPWQLVRDIDLDGSGAIYVAGSHNAAKQTSIPPAAWFASAFQQTSRGASDLVVAKIASNGSRVEWATYLGGSGNDGSAPTVRVKDDDGTVYVLQQTQSTDLPVTASAYQRTNGGEWDFSLARFTASGSALIFSTYLGGSGSETLETHEMVLDDLGNAYVSGWTFSPDFPTTAGALQPDLRGPNDIPLAKISADGSQLLTSTYLGGNADDGVEGIQIDAQGNVNIFGTTRSSDFQVTADAFQSQLGGAGDFFVAKLSPDLHRILYASYLGGVGDDFGRAGWVDHTGRLITGGSTGSDDWPLLHPIQNTRGRQGDGALAKIALSPSVPPSTPDPVPIRQYLPMLMVNTGRERWRPKRKPSVAAEVGRGMMTDRRLWLLLAGCTQRWPYRRRNAILRPGRST